MPLPPTILLFYLVDCPSELLAQGMGGRCRMPLQHPEDALVLKATAIVLTRHLEPHLSKQCYHLAGRGGAKAAVRAVANNLDGNTFVFRTDVKSYYASIDHDVLVGQLQRYVKDGRVLKLLWRYVHRLVVQDGRYREVHRGIPLGCPISPLVGANNPVSILIVVDLPAPLGPRKP